MLLSLAVTGTNLDGGLRLPLRAFVRMSHVAVVESTHFQCHRLIRCSNVANMRLNCLKSLDKGQH